VVGRCRGLIFICHPLNLVQNMIDTVQHKSSRHRYFGPTSKVSVKNSSPAAQQGWSGPVCKDSKGDPARIFFPTQGSSGLPPSMGPRALHVLHTLLLRRCLPRKSVFIQPCCFACDLQRLKSRTTRHTARSVTSGRWELSLSSCESLFVPALLPAWLSGDGVRL